MEIKFRDLVKHSSKFSGVALLTKVLGFPKSIILALVLVPEDYGKVGLIMLYISYMGFFNPGNVNAAFREMPGLLKKGEDSKVRFIQNNAFSFDLVISLVLFAGLLVYSVFQEGIEMKLLFALAAIWFLVERVRSYQTMQNLSRLDFGFAARINLIVAVVNFILAIAMVYVIGIYALVLPLVLGELTALFYQYKKKGLMGYQFQLNKPEIIRAAKIGLPLILLSFLYKAFESITSKTLIAKYLTEADLGLFVFSLNIALLGMQLLKDIANVYRPQLWIMADTEDDPGKAFSSVTDITQIIGVLGGIILGLAQIGFIYMVNEITVNFREAQWMFMILSFCIFFVGVQAPSEFVLTSRRVNKQKVTVLIWSFALAVNIGLSLLAVNNGYGLVGITMALVISQFLASFTMMVVASTFFAVHQSVKRKIALLFRMTGPLLLTITVFLFHWIFLKQLSMPLFVSISILIQILIWSLYLLAYYRQSLIPILKRILP